MFLLKNLFFVNFFKVVEVMNNIVMMRLRDVLREVVLKGVRWRWWLLVVKVVVSRCIRG